MGGTEHAQAFLVTLWTYGALPTFSSPAAAGLFCRVLGRLRHDLGFRVHAYVVLPDRARLILGASDRDPRWVRIAVQRLKSRFAREWNSRSGRLGLVWQDADQRLPLGDTGDIRRRADLLHLNPVMAGLAGQPGAWRYSSYRAWNGGGRTPTPVDLIDGGGAARASG
jgi:hypothetical protein